MHRIIDKNTKLFLRDDLTHNPSTETALDVEPAQGMYIPKWSGKKWVESETTANIKAKKDKAEKDRTPTIEERIAAIEKKLGI